MSVSGKRSVKDFVETAFPVSTVPFDKRHWFRDYSFNFASYDRWESGGCYVPGDEEDKDLRRQFPIWPADMFAVTGALLERSAAYQRLADAIRPLKADADADASDPDEIDARANPGRLDSFGVREPYRLHLRLIGTLWAFGALIVSGLHRRETLLSRQEIAEKNAMRVCKAIEFLRDRMNREINFKELEKVQERITKHVFQRIGLDEPYPDFNAVLTAARRGESDFIPTAAAVLSLEAIQRHHDAVRPRLAPAGETEEWPQRHYWFSGGISEIQPYALIIWASEYIQLHWQTLRASKRPISLPCSADAADEDMAWWRAATRLHVIADEAGKGMGLSARRDEPKAEIPTARQRRPFKTHQAGEDCRMIWERHQAAFDAVLLSEARATERSLRFKRTLTRCFEDELGSVLPKARTPGCGCTLRSMSHNFALLPPKGRIRARWARQSEPDDEPVYNILVVPYPYQIKSPYIAPSTPYRNDEDWDFFTISPGWLQDPDPALAPARETAEQMAKRGREEFWNFMNGLLADQARGAVHAVVLPEGALDWETFDIVQEGIARNYPEITMLVCGLTSAKFPGDGDRADPQRGNFVATYMRTRAGTRWYKPLETGDLGWRILHIRAKHHRWRLDASQLRTYALSQQLSPNKLWWEDIPLPPREMLFAEFMAGSIVNTLICEDLARIEPCQVALRAVGPNLVLVLLMDNAQIFKRWPYQYAGVLSDDPGSSVLTLSSFGLINRSNLSENRVSREIALWREPHGGGAIEINLPQGYDAQLVSLRRDFCLERTLDGRGDNEDSAAIWKFAGLIPIRSPHRPPGGRA